MSTRPAFAIEHTPRRQRTATEKQHMRTTHTIRAVDQHFHPGTSHSSVMSRKGCLSSPTLCSRCSLAVPRPGHDTHVGHLDRGRCKSALLPSSKAPAHHRQGLHGSASRANHNSVLTSGWWRKWQGWLQHGSVKIQPLSPTWRINCGQKDRSIDAWISRCLVQQERWTKSQDGKVSLCQGEGMIGHCKSELP